ncbi:MAG: MFS transporter [Candidatus Hydrogenedentes bacterium]|nr:MFS transporter [Candidatus Hydrogenedentota bacterium]
MAKLPFRTQLTYGLGGLGINLCDMVFLQWLFVRYTAQNATDGSSALVSASVIGVVVFLARVGECFYNIGVGHWSDNFRSPLGRRIPFIRRGLIPLAVVFFILFMPPGGLPGAAYGFYVFVFLNLYLFLYAVVVTPYLSLLPEVTSDLHERVNLTTLQSLFIVVSLIIFSQMGLLLETLGWVGVATIVSLNTVLALTPCALFIREKPARSDEEEVKPRLFESLALTLKNPAFLCIAVSTSFFWFSLQLILLMLPFWVMYVLHRDVGDVTWVMVPYLVMSVVSFFFFNVLTKRFGKFPMFLVTLLGSAVFFVLFCAVGYLPFGSEFVQTIVVSGLVGIPVAGFMVIPFALLSDAVDYDEQLTGQRREAIFFGLQGVFQKIMLGASAFTFSRLLAVGGQDTATTTGLKLVAMSAGIGGALAFFAFLVYPLRERDGKVVHKKA